VVGYLMQTLLQISWWVRQWKNYENRPIYDEVIVKIKRCAFFLRHSVYILWFPDVQVVISTSGSHIIHLVWYGFSFQFILLITHLSNIGCIASVSLLPLLLNWLTGNSLMSYSNFFTFMVISSVHIVKLLQFFYSFCWW